MALLQWKLPLDSPWPDRLAIGEFFLPLLGIGTMYRRRIRTLEDYLLYMYRRSEL